MCFVAWYKLFHPFNVFVWVSDRSSDTVICNFNMMFNFVVVFIFRRENQKSFHPLICVSSSWLICICVFLVIALCFAQIKDKQSKRRDANQKSLASIIVKKFIVTLSRSPWTEQAHTKDKVLAGVHSTLTLPKSLIYRSRKGRCISLIHPHRPGSSVKLPSEVIVIKSVSLWSTL